MSYRQNYSASVSYSGSKTVSYPASENGGSKTVYYEGNIPIDISILVDTDDFDTSVHHCNTQVNALTASVAAMNAAQVASIQKSSKAIADHITNGFFNLVKSEISQNTTVLFSKMQSSIGLIKEKTDFVSNRMNTMQSDYARMLSWYANIFLNLDEETRRRIIELDKPAFQLSRTVLQKQLSEAEAKQTASFLLGLDENIVLQSKLGVANLNGKVATTIYRIASYVNQENIYTKKVKDMMHHKSYRANTETFMPVIYLESDSLDDDESRANVFTSQTSLFEKEDIQKETKNFFAQERIPTDSETDEALIDKSFNKIFERESAASNQENDETAKRVFEMIRTLKNQNSNK